MLIEYFWESIGILDKTSIRNNNGSIVYIYIRLLITKLPYKLVKRPPKRVDRQFIYFVICRGEKIF